MSLDSGWTSSIWNHVSFARIREPGQHLRSTSMNHRDKAGKPFKIKNTMSGLNCCSIVYQQFHPVYFACRWDKMLVDFLLLVQRHCLPIWTHKLDDNNLLVIIFISITIKSHWCPSYFGILVSQCNFDSYSSNVKYTVWNIHKT